MMRMMKKVMMMSLMRMMTTRKMTSRICGDKNGVTDDSRIWIENHHKYSLNNLCRQ